MDEEKPPIKEIKRRAPGAGRPPAIVCDEDTLKRIRALSSIQCTQAEAAGVFHCSLVTFNQFLNGNKKAKEAWEMGKDEGKASLRRVQWKMAERSAAMAIWLGKQCLGQKDKTAIVGDPDSPPVSIEHGLEHGLSVLLLAARDAKAKREGNDDK